MIFFCYMHQHILFLCFLGEKIMPDDFIFSSDITSSIALLLSTISLDFSYSSIEFCSSVMRVVFLSNADFRFDFSSSFWI
jgi:hypothetical protein